MKIDHDTIKTHKGILMNVKDDKKTREDYTSAYMKNIQKHEKDKATYRSHKLSSIENANMAEWEKAVKNHKDKHDLLRAFDCYREMINKEKEYYDKKQKANKDHYKALLLCRYMRNRKLERKNLKNDKEESRIIDVNNVLEDKANELAKKDLLTDDHVYWTTLQQMNCRLEAMKEIKEHHLYIKKIMRAANVARKKNRKHDKMSRKKKLNNYIATAASEAVNRQDILISIMYDCVVDCDTYEGPNARKMCANHWPSCCDDSLTGGYTNEQVIELHTIGKKTMRNWKKKEA